MTEAKLKVGLEGEKFSYFFRVDVYKHNGVYAMPDPNPNDQASIPFSRCDHFSVEKAYSVYTLDQKQVYERVKEAVAKEKWLYSVRVYLLPLNEIISDWNWTILDEASWNLIVFDSKGEVIRNTGRNSFKAGEIVEYHDLEENEVWLAVVYEPPKSKEDSERSKDSDDDLYHQDQIDYKLLTNAEESDWMYIHASCIGNPTFPVSDALKEKLERVYKKKVEDVKNGNLSFADLLGML